MPSIRAALPMICLVYAATAAAAEPVTDNCPSTRPRVRVESYARIARSAPNTTRQPVDVRANAIDSPSSTIGQFHGDVELIRGIDRVLADELQYDRTADQVQARGHVQLLEGGNQFEAETLDLNLSTRLGTTEASRYSLAHDLGRGDARRIEFAGPDLTRMKQARFTTCPSGNDDWFLNLRALEIDTKDDVGTAHHATLEFLGVPFLYFPYFSFPTSDQRKSGFLFPDFGHRDRAGTILAIPYYLNLAPNYDATLTPRLFTDRGLQLDTETRYLGRELNGQLDLAYLPSDNIVNSHRAAAAVRYQQTLNPFWSLAVNAQTVSDLDYLSDFGEDLDATSKTHLPRTVALDYRGSIWDFTTRASNYQTVDRSVAPIDRPYARLPQLLLASKTQTFGPLHYRVEGEWVNFDHNAKITGQRLNVNPAARAPVTRPYGFVIPEIGLHHIGYRLSDPVSPSSVTVPFAAIDSGLILERDGEGYTQTLEPRVFYLRAPNRRQDQLPLFDTGVPDFSFANLFRTNRFLGGDRIGDANQATLALTTRLLDADGAERARASIGRIYYFDDAEVNVPPGTVTADASDVAAETLVWLANNVHAHATLQWSADDRAAQRGSLYAQYQPAHNQILNVGYRRVRDSIEQVDTSIEWPLSPRWLLRARSLYSPRDNRHVDTFLGLDYRSCCWVARVHVFRRLTQAATEAIATAEEISGFMFQFEFSGLGKLGDAPQSPLRQGLFEFPTSP